MIFKATGCFFFLRFYAVIGPRTLQFGQNYNVFVTSTDYDEYDNEKLKLELVGKKFGDEIETKSVDLNFGNKNVTFEVQ